MQAFELLFRLSQMTWIGHRVALGIRQKFLEAQINAGLLASRNVLDLALCGHRELREVSIGPAKEAYPFDLLCWEGFNGAPSHQTQAPDAAAIGESDMPSIWFELPTSLFILDTATIVLKLWIAFLAWFVGAAVVIEAGDRGPGPIRSSLPGLGVEAGCKSELFGKLGGEALQVISVGATSIHPEAQAFVAHKLRGSDRLLDGAILGVCP